MNRFFSDTKYAISWGILGLIVLSVLGAVFLLVQTFASAGWINNQDYPNTIVVSGVGEAVAVPDVATFSFSVVESSEDVASAQNIATEKFNKVFEYLKNSGIEEKDMKTTGYNVYPKYEWIQPICISEISCPRGKNELVGYEVSQSVKVKVRDTQKAGDILSGIGSFNVSNISGLNFEVDDEEALIADARSKAIEDAKVKAKKLAKELGVNLVDIIGFNEGYEGPVYESYMESKAYGLGGDMMMESPSIPTGENQIERTVYITYKIR